jgi:septal ring factor EnvC (AmiA/AmiB activator)
VFWRRKPSVTDDQIREIAKALRNVREDLDDLAHKHNKLRGKFYGDRNPVRAEAADADHNSGETSAAGTENRPSRRSAPSKSELLARYFTPGRPTVHTGG